MAQPPKSILGKHPRTESPDMPLAAAPPASKVKKTGDVSSSATVQQVLSSTKRSPSMASGDVEMQSQPVQQVVIPVTPGSWGAAITSSSSGLKSQIKLANEQLKALRAQEKKAKEAARAAMNKAIAQKLAAKQALTPEEAKFQKAEADRSKRNALKKKAKETAGESSTQAKIRKLAHGYEIKISAGAVAKLNTMPFADAKTLVERGAAVLKAVNKTVLRETLLDAEIAKLSLSRKN